MEVSGDVASFLSRSGRVTASGSRGRFSTILSGSLYESAGPARLFFPEFASPDTNNGFADNVDGERVAHLFSDVRYGNFTLQSFYASRFKILPTAPYGTIFNDSGTRTTDNSISFDADYRLNLNPTTDVDLRAFYHDYEYEGTYAYAYDNPSGRILNYDSGRGQWTGFETILNHQIARHRLTLGGNYEYNFHIDQKTFYPGFPPELDDHRTPWLAAVYGEAELKLLSFIYK